MELSDLVVFNGKLLTVDDRTGIIYEIINGQYLKPWITLYAGPGDTSQPMKAEWMTNKDGLLYVGGHGILKIDLKTKKVIDDHHMWIKVIDANGRIQHVSWVENYNKIVSALGINTPGYVTHEAVQWSDYHKRWFFLPRRVSLEVYNDDEDEYKGARLLISVDEYFQSPPIVVHVGGGNEFAGNSSLGFSAFQFVPRTRDSIVVAIKSQEINGLAVASYSTVFDINGNILEQDKTMEGPLKFEGIAVT